MRVEINFAGLMANVQVTAAITVHYIFGFIFVVIRHYNNVIHHHVLIVTFLHYLQFERLYACATQLV